MSETKAGARPGGGLVAGAKNGVSVLIRIGRTRLELLGNELKEEKLRAVRLLLWSQMLAFCLIVATILLVALLVVAYWEDRIVLLVGSTTLFIVGSGIAYRALQGALRRPGHSFSNSLAQLDEDLRQLQRTASDESRTD